MFVYIVGCLTFENFITGHKKNPLNRKTKNPQPRELAEPDQIIRTIPQTTPAPPPPHRHPPVLPPPSENMADFGDSPVRDVHHAPQPIWRVNRKCQEKSHLQPVLVPKWRFVLNYSAWGKNNTNMYLLWSPLPQRYFMQGVDYLVWSKEYIRPLATRAQSPWRRESLLREII